MKYSPDVTPGQRLTDGRGRSTRLNHTFCDLEPQGVEKLGESPNGHHLQIEHHQFVAILATSFRRSRLVVNGVARVGISQASTGICLSILLFKEWRAKVLVKLKRVNGSLLAPDSGKNVVAIAWQRRGRADHLWRHRRIKWISAWVFIEGNCPKFGASCALEKEAGRQRVTRFNRIPPYSMSLWFPLCFRRRQTIPWRGVVEKGESMLLWAMHCTPSLLSASLSCVDTNSLLGVLAGKRDNWRVQWQKDHIL